MSAPSSLKVVGMGNPLLDISAEVSTDLLKKYDLEPSNAILAEEKHLPLYEELVKEHKVQYVPGGSCLNTMRFGAWMWPEAPEAFGYMGSVGDDESAKILRKEVEKDKVYAHFHVDTATPTGRCAALITNKQRSLVAHLSAAEKFEKAHVDSALAKDMVKKASIVYVTSFFLTVSVEAAESLAKAAMAENKTFVMNLSAPFLLEVPLFFERVKTMLPYMDYVFCNDHESKALAKAMGWPEDDQREIARRTAELPKHNAKRARTVIFTQGAKPAVVFHEGELHEFPVIVLNAEQIVDENGAGDAFLGGFLAGLAQGKPFREAMAMAAYAAYCVIQQHGCSLPPKRPIVEHLGFDFGEEEAK